MIWGAIFKIFITILIGELLRPKPNIENARPAELGDFNFPTATEGRSVPLFWGTVETKGSNLIWYGDLRSVAITQKVKKNLFSSKRVTVGHRYFVGLDFSIGMGPFTNNGYDGLRKVRIDDRDVLGIGSPGLEGPVYNGTVSIDQPEFTNENFNIIGNLDVVPGTSGQGKNSYLSGVVDDSTLLPAYRNIIHYVWNQGEVGNSTNLLPWAFIQTRIPDGLNLATTLSPTDTFHVIDGLHANPMNVLFDIMTNTIWGLGISSGEIDITNFREVAAILHGEGNGFSMILDSPRSAVDLINEIERQTNGLLILDETTGFYEFLLAREPDVFPGTSPELVYTVDRSNCKSVEYSSTSWDSTINQVRVPYADPDKNFKETNAVAVDAANVRIQGTMATVTLRFPGCKDPELANKLAWRELQQRSTPISKVTCVVNREIFLAKPTQLFDLTWPEYGLDNIRYRINRIDYGDLDNGWITIEAVENIFQTPVSGFKKPGPTNWVPPSSDATTITLARLFEVPKSLMGDLGSPIGTWVGVVAEEPNSFQTGYDVHIVRNPGGSPANNTVDSDFSFETSVPGYAPTGELVGTLLANDPFVGSDSPPDSLLIDNTSKIVDVIAAGSAQLTDNDTVNIFNYILVDDEWIFYESIIDVGSGQYRLQGLHRGMLDSVPANHFDNAKVWFMAFDMGIVLADFGKFDLIEDNFIVRLLSNTPTQIEPIETAIELSLDLTHRFQGEYPPARPTLNGEYFPNVGEASSPVGFTSATFEVKWLGRNGDNQIPTGPVVTQNDIHEDPATGTEYVFEIWRADRSPEVLVQQVTGLTIGSPSNTSPEGGEYVHSVSPEYIIRASDRSPQISPESDVLQYRCKLYSRRNGVDSQIWETPIFTIVESSPG